MSRYYGSRCGIANNCVGNHPGWWCECDGQGNCSEGGVGDFGIEGLVGDDLHKYLSASTTKFEGKWNKEGNLVLENVGMLADAGLRPFDTLIGVVEISPAQSRYTALKNDRIKILTWDFLAPEVGIIYSRSNGAQSGVMANPQFK
jgi:hypothetical protein